MIDTNQLAQAVAVAEQVKSQVSYNWPAICALAALAARELRNFNAWCVSVAEYVIGHGGAGMIVKKLIWNPGAGLTAKNAESTKQS